MKMSRKMNGVWWTSDSDQYDSAGWLPPSVPSLLAALQRSCTAVEAARWRLEARWWRLGGGGCMAAAVAALSQPGELEVIIAVSVVAVKPLTD